MSIVGKTVTGTVRTKHAFYVFTPTTTLRPGLVMGIINRGKIADVHQIVNSQRTQMVETIELLRSEVRALNTAAQIQKGRAAGGGVNLPRNE